MKSLLALLVVGALALTACSGTKELYGVAGEAQVAGDVTAYARAVLVHHNALGTAAADFIANPAVTDSAKNRVREAYRVTVCSGEEIRSATGTANCRAGPSYLLDAAIRAVEGARNATTEAELTAALTRLTPVVTALLNALN